MGLIWDLWDLFGIYWIYGTFWIVGIYLVLFFFGGEGIHLLFWDLFLLDGDNPYACAEKELIAVASNIEEAARKLSKLRPRATPKVI